MKINIKITDSYYSVVIMNAAVKCLSYLEILSLLQQQGSSAAAEMEMERLKIDSQKSMQMVQQWKKMYENLHQFCVNELLDVDRAGVSN